MKKLLTTLLILLGIGAVAVVTCPDKQAHKDAIMEVVNGAINDELAISDEDDLDLSVFFGTIGSGIAGHFVDNRLTVKNHFVYSIGVIRDLDGINQHVSFGVFGHVFTGGKEQLKKAVNGK